MNKEVILGSLLALISLVLVFAISTLFPELLISEIAIGIGLGLTYFTVSYFTSWLISSSHSRSTEILLVLSFWLRLTVFAFAFIYLINHFPFQPLALAISFIASYSFFSLGSLIYFNFSWQGG